MSCRGPAGCVRIRTSAVEQQAGAAYVVAPISPIGPPRRHPGTSGGSGFDGGELAGQFLYTAPFGGQQILQLLESPLGV